MAEIHFRYMIKSGEEARDGFLDAVAAIPELGIDAAAVREAGFRKRPIIDLALLRDDRVRAALFAAVAGLAALG